MKNRYYCYSLNCLTTADQERLYFLKKMPIGQARRHFEEDYSSLTARRRFRHGNIEYGDDGMWKSYHDSSQSHQQMQYVENNAFVQVCKLICNISSISNSLQRVRRYRDRGIRLSWKTHGFIVLWPQRVSMMRRDKSIHSLYCAARTNSHLRTFPAS